MNNQYKVIFILVVINYFLNLLHNEFALNDLLGQQIASEITIWKALLKYQQNSNENVFAVDCFIKAINSHYAMGVKVVVEDKLINNLVLFSYSIKADIIVKVYEPFGHL